MTRPFERLLDCARRDMRGGVSEARLFIQAWLEAIAGTLGDTSIGLTNAESEFLIHSTKMVDPGNPTAHEAKIHWSMTKADAEGLLSIASLIHRRLDSNLRPPRA